MKFFVSEEIVRYCRLARENINSLKNAKGKVQKVRIECEKILAELVKDPAKAIKAPVYTAIALLDEVKFNPFALARILGERTIEFFNESSREDSESKEKANRYDLSCADFGMMLNIRKKEIEHFLCALAKENAEKLRDILLTVFFLKNPQAMEVSSGRVTNPTEIENFDPEEEAELVDEKNRLTDLNEWLLREHSGVSAAFFDVSDHTITKTFMYSLMLGKFKFPLTEKEIEFLVREIGPRPNIMKTRKAARRLMPVWVGAPKEIRACLEEEYADFARNEIPRAHVAIELGEESALDFFANRLILAG